jgi:hypothetical protein
VVDIYIVKECNGGKKSTHKVLWKKEKWWPALCRGSLGTWSSFSLYVLFSVCVCVCVYIHNDGGTMVVVVGELVVNFR